MTKKELIARIAEETGNTKKSTEAFVNAYEQVIKDALAARETVELYGFMKMTVKQVSEREGVNPGTGERIMIPAYSKVSIKPLKGLKECVK